MKKLILILTLAAFAAGPIAEAQAASHVTPIAAMHKAAGKHHGKKAGKKAGKKHGKHKMASHKRASL